MRKPFGFALIGLAGLCVQIAACAEGSTLQPSGGAGGNGNEGGDSTGGSNSGGSGGSKCTTEVCDGIDNNCDGQIDEGCECKAGQTEACYSGTPETAGVGSCKAGVRICDTATNTFGPCKNEVLPKAETCNGSDDDCNGTVDDGIADIMCGIGGCAVVVSGCVNGAPGDCVPGQPSLEMCDGIDNDCDQLTDETFPENGKTCDTGIPGICSVGTSQCTAGVLTCAQTNMPSMEICDGLDNDCSGTVDDNIPGTGIPCSTGLLGVCATGTYACKNNAIDCFADKTPSAEVCDGLDNNCNGTVDENNPEGGGACMTGMAGICAPGTLKCTAGALVCNSNLLSQPESCNGIDDNCNGQTDENNPGSGMACSCGGTTNCSAGKIVCQGCTKEVICNNGINDDGDMKVDCQDTDCALGCSTSITPCAAGETLLVLASTNVPKAIPDNGSVTSTLAFSETMTVKRVVLQIDIAHTWDSDLIVNLKSPSGTSILMTNRRGFTLDNYTNTIFFDGCANPISSGSAPFSGCYMPEAPLSGFIGQSLAGTWNLVVQDVNTNDTGTLNAWTLAVCAQ